MSDGVRDLQLRLSVSPLSEARGSLAMITHPPAGYAVVRPAPFRPFTRSLFPCVDAGVRFSISFKSDCKIASVYRHVSGIAFLLLWFFHFEDGSAFTTYASSETLFPASQS